MGVVEGRLISPRSLSARGTRALLVFTIALVASYSILRMSSQGYYPAYIYNHLAKYLNYDGVYNNTLYQYGTEDMVHPHWNFSEPCRGFPDLDDITLVMKTGATEAFDRMPTQLLTSLQCVPDFLLFSDLEQQIGKYHVYNVLDRVDEMLKLARAEFVLYEAQQNCPISQKECTKDIGGGWDLDKYKFLNMIVRTWEMRPNRKWYVFAEGDTYIVWSNLVQWLREKADPQENLYVGSVAFIANLPFAHGGSGYVMSGVLVKKLIEEIPNLRSKYDELAPKTCCGDGLLSQAIDDVGVSVKQAHPMFNGEKPNTLPFGPTHWCQPLFTMHHMNSEEISSVWQYEQTRTKTDPLQLRDIYQAFFAPNLVSRRENWDNTAYDTCYIGPEKEDQAKAGGEDIKRQKAHKDKSIVERQAHESADACARVCEAEGVEIDDGTYEALGTESERNWFLRVQFRRQASNGGFKKARKCFQWRYRDGVCCTGSSFVLGKPKPHKEKEATMTSGWFVEGIENWIDVHGQCSNGTEWKEPTCVGKHCHKEEDEI